MARDVLNTWYMVLGNLKETYILKEIYILLLWGEVSYKCWLDPIGLSYYWILLFSPFKSAYQSINCTGSTLWYLQQFLQYTIVEFSSSIILLYPPFPIPRVVSTSLIFPCTYMCTWVHDEPLCQPWILLYLVDFLSSYSINC
jgi:hypothetical protein